MYGTSLLQIQRNYSIDSNLSVSYLSRQLLTTNHRRGEDFDNSSVSRIKSLSTNKVAAVSLKGSILAYFSGKEPHSPHSGPRIFDLKYWNCLHMNVLHKLVGLAYDYFSLSNAPDYGNGVYPETLTGVPSPNETYPSPRAYAINGIQISLSYSLVASMSGTQPHNL